jgi:hypothetical protein
MRAACIWSGLACLLLAPIAAGQAPGYQAVVSAPEADVYCRPGYGPPIYATNRLHRGDLVVVQSERPDGWLEILPPAGSYSWINQRCVKSKTPPSAPTNNVVDVGPGDDAPVIAGMQARADVRGSVQSARLPSGTIVVGLAYPAVTDAEGTWLAISAPYGETRFIRSELVTKAAGRDDLRASVTTQTTNYTPGGPAAAPSSAQPGLGQSEAERMWQRALAAERAGQINEAIQLYSQLAQQATGSTYELAMQGLNRAYWLRESQRCASPTTIPSVTPGMQTAPATTQSSHYGSAAGLDLASPAVRLTAPTTSPPPPMERSYYSQRPTTPSAPWQPVTPEGYSSSGVGILRRSGRVVENSRTYVLNSVQDYPMLYVTAGPGLNSDFLEPYVNQKVELIGQAIYRGDLRANYMRVMRVQPVP